MQARTGPGSKLLDKIDELEAKLQIWLHYGFLEGISDPKGLPKHKKILFGVFWSRFESKKITFDCLADLERYYENERKEIPCQIAAYAQMESLAVKDLYSGMQPVIGNVLTICERFATYRYLLKAFKAGDEPAAVMADITSGRQLADAVLKEYNKINMMQLRKAPIELKQLIEEVYNRLQPLSYVKHRNFPPRDPAEANQHFDSMNMIHHHIQRLPTPVELNELLDPLEVARKHGNERATADLVNALHDSLHKMRDVRMDVDRLIQRIFTNTQVWMEDIINKYNLIVANKAWIRDRLRVLEVHNHITLLRGTHEPKEPACMALYKAADNLRDACKDASKSFLSKYWEGTISVTEEIRRFADEMKAFTATYLPHYVPLHEWLEQNTLIETKKLEQLPLCEGVLQALQQARLDWKQYKKEMIEAEQIVLNNTKAPASTLQAAREFISRHWIELTAGGTCGMGLGALGFVVVMHPMSLALVILGSTVVGLGAGTGTAVTREFLKAPASPGDHASEFDKLLTGDDDVVVQELTIVADPINLQREYAARHITLNAEDEVKEEKGLLSLSLSLSLPTLSMSSFPFWQTKQDAPLEELCDKLVPPQRLV